jgi:RNA polymerase sigma-70 factor, ECF subfamily
MSSYPTALQDARVLHPSESDAEGLRVRAERTDNQLVELVLAGDETAFEQIFERYKRLVAIIASRYFRRIDEIEEIIQISFAKAFVEMSAFRGEHAASLSSWLARITANACIDRLRHRNRRPERLTCELTEHEAAMLFDVRTDEPRNGEDKLIDRDLAEKLLSNLKPEDRALLEMFYLEEMTVAEIARLLGVSEANVKVRNWRARKALRKTLKRFL